MVSTFSFRDYLSRLSLGVGRFLPYGLLLYLGSLLFLDGRQSKTIFYFFVGLPALFFIGRCAGYFKVSPIRVGLVGLFFCYFSVSAIWGGGHGFWLAAKYSLYLVCLGVAIQAAIARFGCGFFSLFLAYVGGAAVVLYTVSIYFSDWSLAALISGRFSMAKAAGWGAESPIGSAVVLGVVAISAWWHLSGSRLAHQALLVFVIFLSFCLMFITKSRGPLLALLFVIFFIVFLRRTRADIALFSCMLLCVSLVYFYSGVGEAVASRAVAPNYRLEIWLQAFAQFKDNWIFGAGLGNEAGILLSNGRSVVTHAHSSVFEMFRVGGVVGGGIFIAMVCVVIGNVFGRPKLYFAFSWFVFGMLCLATDGRALLRGTSSEWFEFWIPFFIIFFGATASTLTSANSKLERDGKS